MKDSVCRGGLAIVLALFCLSVAAAPSGAVEYKRDPQLSLTGNCEVSTLDPIPDPSCPYLPPPSGPSGRFDEPKSIAIDAYGNEYVAVFADEEPDGRVDVFDDEGKFITELTEPTGAKSIAVDSEGNLYVWESGFSDVKVSRYAPTDYEPEAGNIEYGDPPVLVETITSVSNGGIAVDSSTDRVFVAAGDTIFKYKAAAEGDESLGNESLGTITGPHINWTNWVAVDAKRDRLYASFCKNSSRDCGIVVMGLDPPHTVLKEILGPGPAGPNDKFISEKGWLSIAVVEETGHFFVDDLEQTDNVYEFDENYNYLQTLNESAFVGSNPLQIAVSNSPLNPTAKNHGFLFVPIQSSTGSVFAFEPIEVLPPEVEQTTVDSVGEAEAEAQATIDPRGGKTKYFIELLGGPSPQIVAQGEIAPDAQPTLVNGIATGLSPGTEYSFRVFASNTHPDDEEVEIGNDEEEVSFFTYSNAPVTESCPNQALRTGGSAILPDCRAYELVTPPDTNGFPPRGIGFAAQRFSTLQASPAGNLLSFRIVGGTLSGFEGTGSFDGDPYLTTRGASSWTTTAAGPDGTVTNAIHPGGISPDQGHSFWQAGEKGPAVIEPGDNGYVRYPDGHSELLGQGSLGIIDPKARGVLITENGTHIVFQTQNVGARLARPLEPNAPPEGTKAVYDRTLDGVTHVVSLLPGEITPAAGKDAEYIGASPDGAGIAFEIENTLYLRLNNSVTHEVGGPGAEFAGVSAGGERVFYVEGGDLLAYDTDTEAVIPFAETGNAIPVNVATDGTRAYFVSTTAIPDSGENPNEDVAQLGQQNLYLSEEGTIRFVATVTERDVEGEQIPVSPDFFDGLGLWTEVLAQRQPARDPSRLTPDGSVMLFQSRANLDDYDSDGAPQIYRYDTVANELECISCVPSKTPAGEGASLQSYAFNDSSNKPFSASGFVPNITPDGRRAFFESTEALVSTDTDGVRDIYEWEANGVGSCTRAQGCVYLISSGRSARENFLYGHSANGDDVFFTTNDVLLPVDTGGTLSIYDARVNGGFAQPAGEACDGEACKLAPTTAPSPPTPNSETRAPSGNVTSKAKPKKCPKGKRKVKRNGKVRCVKKKGNKQQRKKAGAKKRGSAR